MKIEILEDPDSVAEAAAFVAADGGLLAQTEKSALAIRVGIEPSPR
jgi:hypothetical protein